jgi:hypothetical protein
VKEEIIDKKTGGKVIVKQIKVPAKIITKIVEKALVQIDQSGIIVEMQILPGEEDESKEAAKAKQRKILGGESLIEIPDSELDEEGRTIKAEQI